MGILRMPPLSVFRWHLSVLSRLVLNSQAELILLPQSPHYMGLKEHIPLHRSSPPSKSVITSSS